MDFHLTELQLFAMETSRFHRQLYLGLKLEYNLDLFRRHCFSIELLILPGLCVPLCESGQRDLSNAECGWLPSSCSKPPQNQHSPSAHASNPCLPYYADGHRQSRLQSEANFEQKSLRPCADDATLP